MDGGILLDSEQHGGRGNNTRRAKTVRGASVGGPQQKILIDITNLQQQCPKPSYEHSKLRPATLETDNIIDHLHKENATLMKLLANRNAIIESRGAELLKLQSNFQKLQKQNLELARENTQMLRELNSSRQRVRELQLELACKNGILKAKEIGHMEKENRGKVTCEIAANEVARTQSEQSAQTFQADSKGNNHCNGKRRRVSKSQSSVPSATEQVNSAEKIDTLRCRLTRQSIGSKAGRPGQAEDTFGVDDNKSSVSHHKENLVTENTPPSSGPTVQKETSEDVQSLGATNIDQVHAEEKVDNKRRSLRRQSSRFKTENSETTEDSFATDAAKFPVLCLCDDLVVENGRRTSATFGQEDKRRDSANEYEPQEIRRSSVGRPLRQAAEKVQSYREVSRKVKMRRPE